jgi:MFS family permease
MIGSLIGVQLSSIGFSLDESLMLTALALLPILLGVAYILPTLSSGEDLSSSEMKPRDTGASGAFNKALFFIVLVVFGATIVEGAMVDWAAVYMRDVAHIMAGYEGLSGTIFSCFVTIGRFCGDAIHVRFGAASLARICLVFAMLGLTILISNLGVAFSFLGFALVGLGVSVIFPLGVSASAAQSRVDEARNVSIMTFGALSGFLIGPPVIGLLADANTLNVAFAFLLPGLFVSFLLAYRLSVTRRSQFKRKTVFFS